MPHAGKVRFAARFADHLERELRSLPIDGSVGEITRTLGARAEELGLTRPGYAAVRLHVERERLRRARRDAVIEVAVTLATTRVVAPTHDGVARAYADAVERRL